MKRYTGFILFIISFLIFTGNRLFSQVAINTNGSPPNPAAMLDIQSTNKGLLLPRIDFNDRPDPAPAGLMIFVTANGPFGNNALYISNGVGWSMLATANYTLGQFAGGGMVFYVDPTGYHGLISAMTDQSTYTLWGCDSTLIGPGAEHTELGTGDTNTMAILAGCSEPGIAAKVCDTLTLSGYSDWYLPSRDEMDSMYVHRDMIGGFNPNGWYWTSTEVDANGAWVFLFDWVLSGWTSKGYSLTVRCIRKF
jgi:hypothetical protein